MTLEVLKTDLSPRALEKLDSFKASVNPSMNAKFNSSDEVTWYDLLIRLHLDQYELDSDIFQ